MHGGPSYGGLRRAKGITLTQRRAPVGYLVNHPSGLAGVPGIGYDYVLGAGGLYVQSRSAHLVVRVMVAPGSVRGLAPVSEKLTLPHGPIPVYLFEVGCAGSRKPQAPSGSSRCDGTGRLPAGGAGAGWDRLVPHLPAPSRCGRRVPLPRKDPRLLLAHRRPGTSRASVSTGSSDGWTPCGQNRVSELGYTDTTRRFAGARCSTVQAQASVCWPKNLNHYEAHLNQT